MRPGAGKSTLVAALIAEVRAGGRSVAVIAVDPSSPITGGALLGDRVRMQSYAADDGVFIRSMASRGHAGGLAATVRRGRDRARRRRASTSSCSRPSGPARARWRSPRRPTRPSSWRRPRWATRSRRSRRASSRSPTSSSSTRATARAPSGPPASCGRCSRSWRARAGRAGSPAARPRRAPGEPEPSAERPHPKRPEVLVTTATTGEGVPELARGPRRATGHGSARRRAASRSGARARRRSSGRSWATASAGAWSTRTCAAATTAVLDAVVRHELDPYAAADRLLAALVADGEAEPGSRG